MPRHPPNALTSRLRIHTINNRPAGQKPETRRQKSECSDRWLPVTGRRSWASLKMRTINLSQIQHLPNLALAKLNKLYVPHSRVDPDRLLQRPFS
jgi:hypothetical protein